MSDSRGPGSDGPEWLVEHGIGESRALLIHGEEVVAAKLHWPGDLPVDSTALAQLVSKPAGGARGLARMANGTEILIDRIPPRATEGSALTLRITRAAIAERGRFKRAQGLLHQPHPHDDARGAVAAHNVHVPSDQQEPRVPHPDPEAVDGQSAVAPRWV